MERLSEGAKSLNDNEVFYNCSYSCYANLADALNTLEAYEDTGLSPEQVQELKEKQVPKKPYKTDNYTPYCPSCNKFLSKYEPQHGLITIPYCKWCGQAIDWGNE